MRRDADELDGFLEFLAAEIAHRGLRAAVRPAARDTRSASCCGAPRARRTAHHGYAGGLLEHTVGVATLCRETAQLHPRLRSDLLLAAALAARRRPHARARAAAPAFPPDRRGAAARPRAPRPAARRGARRRRSTPPCGPSCCTPSRPTTTRARPAPPRRRCSTTRTSSTPSPRRGRSATRLRIGTVAWITIAPSRARPAAASTRAAGARRRRRRPRLLPRRRGRAAVQRRAARAAVGVHAPTRRRRARAALPGRDGGHGGEVATAARSRRALFGGPLIADTVAARGPRRCRRATGDRCSSRRRTTPRPTAARAARVRCVDVGSTRSAGGAGLRPCRRRGGFWMLFGVDDFARTPRTRGRRRVRIAASRRRRRRCVSRRARHRRRVAARGARPAAASAVARRSPLAGTRGLVASSSVRAPAHPMSMRSAVRAVFARAHRRSTGAADRSNRSAAT